MTIEERLENMERELRRLKRRNRLLLGAIFLVAGGLIAPGVFETMAIRARSQEARTAKEIRANSFVLEDEKGTDRAWLGLFKDCPGLGMYDENGKIRAGLVATNDGSALTMYDEKDNIRVKLGLLKDSPALWIFDETGEKSAMLSVFKDGLGLRIFDEKVKTRVGLGLLKSGPSLVMKDEKGTNRFTAGKTKLEAPDGKVIEYPESSLILFGPDGKVIWSAIK